MVRGEPATDLCKPDYTVCLQLKCTYSHVRVNCFRTCMLQEMSVTARRSVYRQNTFVVKEGIHRYHPIFIYNVFRPVRVYLQGDFIILSVYHCFAFLDISNASKRGKIPAFMHIATSYGLKYPGFEYRWWWDFFVVPRPASRATQRPAQRVPGIFLG